MTGLIVWSIAGLITWLGLLTTSDFILWDDDPVAIMIGLVVSSFLCALLWPFVIMAGIGSLLGSHR